MNAPEINELYDNISAKKYLNLFENFLITSVKELISTRIVEFPTQVYN